MVSYARRPENVCRTQIVERTRGARTTRLVTYIAVLVWRVIRSMRTNAKDRVVPTNVTNMPAAYNRNETTTRAVVTTGIEVMASHNVTGLSRPDVRNTRVRQTPNVETRRLLLNVHALKDTRKTGMVQNFCAQKLVL